MGNLLFRIARLRITGAFIGFAFVCFPFLVPIKKTAQTKRAVAFAHPSPSYEDHALIIPRKAARDIFCLSGEDFNEAVRMALAVRAGDGRDFVLWINGGARQDVMQAHFHLFTGNMAKQKGLDEKSGMTFSPEDVIFWKDLAAGLRASLRRSGASEEAFSMLIQFVKDSPPAIYWV